MKHLICALAAAAFAAAAHAWTASIENYTRHDQSDAVTYVSAYLIDTDISSGTQEERVKNYVKTTRQMLQSGEVGASKEDIEALIDSFDGSIHIAASSENFTGQSFTLENLSALADDFYWILVEHYADGSYNVAVSGYKHRYGVGDYENLVWEVNGPEYDGLRDSGYVHVLPEPTALALLALGVAGVALRRRL